MDNRIYADIAVPPTAVAHGTLRYESVAYICMGCNRVRYLSAMLPPYVAVSEWCKCEEERDDR